MEVGAQGCLGGYRAHTEEVVLAAGRAFAGLCGCGAHGWGGIIYIIWGRVGWGEVKREGGGGGEGEEERIVRGIAR